MPKVTKGGANSTKSNTRRRKAKHDEDDDAQEDDETGARALLKLLTSNKHLLRYVQNEAEQEDRRTRHRRSQPRSSPSAQDLDIMPRDNEEEEDDQGEDNSLRLDSDDDYRLHDSGNESSASGVTFANGKKTPRSTGSAGGDPESRKRSSFPTVTAGRTVQLSKPMSEPRPQRNTPPGSSTTSGAVPSPQLPAPQPQQPNPSHTQPGSTAGSTPTQPTSQAVGQGANPPVTPYKRIANPKKKNETLESGYSPISRDIIEHLKPRYRVFLATENAFPTLDNTTSWATPLIKAALQSGDAGKKNRIVRADDAVYMEDVCKLLHSKAAQLRGHVLSVAKRVAADDFLAVWSGLAGRTRAKKVKTDLLDHRAFIYADTKTRTGMFENAAIRKVIQQSFFTSSSQVFNLGRMETHGEAFKPFPLPAIALACASIKCALDVWTTVEPAKVEFSSATYATVYTKFRKLLDVLIEGDEEAAAFLEMRTAWYKEAWEATGTADSDGDDAAASSEDEEVLARNRAALRASRAARQPEQERASE